MNDAQRYRAFRWMVITPEDDPVKKKVEQDDDDVFGSDERPTAVKFDASLDKLCALLDKHGAAY